MLFAQDDELIYIAEEILEPIFGFNAVKRYFADCARAITSMSLRIGTPHCRVLSTKIRFVFFEMQWCLTTTVPPKRPIAGSVRVSTIVRQYGARLRFSQYSEGSLGALPFVRKCYEQQALLFMRASKARARKE